MSRFQDLDAAWKDFHHGKESAVRGFFKCERALSVALVDATRGLHG